MAVKFDIFKLANSYNAAACNESVVYTNCSYNHSTDRSELSGNDGDDSQSFSSFTCLVNLPDDKVCDCYSDCPGESDELFCSESTPEDRLQDQQQKLNKKRADQGTNFLLDLGKYLGLFRALLYV